MIDKSVSSDVEQIKRKSDSIKVKLYMNLANTLSNHRFEGCSFLIKMDVMIKSRFLQLIQSSITSYLSFLIRPKNLARVWWPF